MRGHVRSLGLCALLALAACPRSEAPPAPAAAPPPAPVAPAPPLPPPVIDAAAADAAADAQDAKPPAGGGHHRSTAAPEGGPATKGGIQKLTVDGNVPRGDVEHALHAATSKLKACAKGKGQVEIALTIGERGWPTLVDEKRTTLPGADSETCIVNTLRALRFPKPADGKDTAVSFVLQFR